jgi:His-Xaa-Ser system protein HxsD
MGEQAVGHTFLVATGAYDRAAVVAAAHRFTDRWAVRIDNAEDGHLRVTLTPMTSAVRGGGEDPSAAFWNHLLDEQLRLQIAQRTASVRESIYRHAFQAADADER